MCQICEGMQIFISAKLQSIKN
uniref:Uncharacterized protein n=1 Tax=Rhizophora mucronata TaxID=61149 RepID=A0A2P2QQ14_RHIMU